MTVTPDKNATPKTFGERLVLLMKLAGFKSRPQLARAAEVSDMTITRAVNMQSELGNKARAAIIGALRKRVSFDESWLMYGTGTGPNSAQETTPPQGVLDYLNASGLAVGIDEETRAALLRFPWGALCVANPSTDQIALVRHLIETNLRDASQ